MAPAAALAARWVLAIAFGWSAAAKVCDRSSVPEQMRALGMPAVLARALSVLLPAAEAAIAVALVVLPHVWWPAWASVMLMAAFTVLVVATMSRGVACPCFGLSATPTGVRTIVRNGVLLGVAVLATGPIDGARAGPMVACAVVLGSTVAASIVGAARLREA